MSLASSINVKLTEESPKPRNCLFHTRRCNSDVLDPPRNRQIPEHQPPIPASPRLQSGGLTGRPPSRRAGTDGTAKPCLRLSPYDVATRVLISQDDFPALWRIPIQL